jgi:hypothetical protein
MRRLADAGRDALRKHHDPRDPAKRRRKRKKLGGLPYLGFGRPGWVSLYRPQ